MLALLLIALLTGSAPPALPPCRVQAFWQPAPGLSASFDAPPWRIITVTADQDCSPARIALANYGGDPERLGQVLTLPAGQRLRIGPVPFYRRLVWLATSDLPYDVPLPRGAP